VWKYIHPQPSYTRCSAWTQRDVGRRVLLYTCICLRELFGQTSLMSVAVYVLPQQPVIHIIVVLANNVSPLFLHHGMSVPVLMSEQKFALGFQEELSCPGNPILYSHTYISLLRQTDLRPNTSDWRVLSPIVTVSHDTSQSLHYAMPRCD
jgi:hypothetical protein